MLYAFFWVITRGLNFMCRRFGTHCLFHLHRRVGMKNDWVSEILGYLYRKMFGSKIAWANKERRQPPKTQQFDLYHSMAHPHTCPISFTYLPMASMWVITLHSLFLYSDPPLPRHPPSYWLRLFSSQTFSHINTPTFLKPSHSSYLPAYEDGTDRVFRNVGI